LLNNLTNTGGCVDTLIYQCFTAAVINHPGHAMFRPVRLLRHLLGAVALLSAASASAVVRLPSVLSDHAVLLRAASVPVWGWAAPQEAVTVEFGQQVVTTRADADGRWRVALDLRQAPAAAATLHVRGAANALAVEDVLVGEVWLASGQSNMEKPLGEKAGQQPVPNAQQEIAAADYPEIRLFKVLRKKANQPLDDVSGVWERCAPSSIGRINFSAAAYFFGRRLHQQLRAPVGLIDASWGGTRIEPWTPAAPGADNTAALFNGMIAGLAPHALRGAIWYQGESNIDDSDLSRYTEQMAALINGWRRHFDQPDLAFYYVQVAPHFYHLVRRKTVLDPQAAPRLWEAQADALRLPHTGMIVTTDLVDDLYDIHPRDKQTVGLRLANVALRQTYGRADIAAFGPSFRALAIAGRQAVLTFDHADGLAARDGKPLTWFDIAGADGQYHAGDAIVRDGQVIVTSPQVAAPVAVRFGWDEAAQPNLVNRAGLPAVPFRSHRELPSSGSHREPPSSGSHRQLPPPAQPRAPLSQ
jgi:sialate O-acetylesterase